MSDNEDVASEVGVPTAVDPYEVLRLASTATEDEVKKAYRKAALKNHPDKAPADRKEEAHSAFQHIAFAYGILSDPARRKLYDETGSTEESISADPDWSWTDFYRAQFADVVTADAISAFAAKYRGSDEERRDLLNAYTNAEGDMDNVYTKVMLSNIVEDDERFRAIINKAIEAGEAEEYPTYKGDTRAKRDKRRKKANKEAEEAEEMAKHLGVHDKLFDGGNTTAPESDQKEEAPPKKKKSGKAVSAKKKAAKKEKADPKAGLAALIHSRQIGRANNDVFLDRLAEKYGAKEPRKKAKKNGKASNKAAEREDEPDDDAFEATRRRLDEQRKKRKAAAAADDEDEDEDPAPKRRSRRVKS
ncbi:DnaJ-domain-containing protein [Zalerion maritima]|uniref:DnaJ-domain-containing protein n=1 Tax=Zalerion maritima TaxID=339359 RepID=A0AAD5WR58_9PEZI|nr:DnaJ-domain-containing protein [Zalerion maritima]